MNTSFSLQPSEETVFSLRSLYDQYGYKPYKMSKFEEYDLYAHNKDFLVSDSVITFTDTNGRLMALKPDVTLSIVKNTKDMPRGIRKLYYNENVYRVSKGTHAFRELLQVGLECIGDVDDYCLFEVLKLAAESLRRIRPDSVLDVSHLGILTELLDSIGVPAEHRAELFSFIGEKNSHELTNACISLGIADKDIQILRTLIGLHGTPSDILPRLHILLNGYVKKETLDQFTSILSSLENAVGSDILKIDFSVIDDIHYYNGFVFKGFLQGIPSSVLSGGQYDRLMKKMNRKSAAVGFAVYLDLLEQLHTERPAYDVDALIVYDHGEKLNVLRELADGLIEDGYSVLTSVGIPDGIHAKRILTIRNGEVISDETNA